MTSIRSKPVQIAAGRARLNGCLTIPSGAAGLVILAQAGGSHRVGDRNRSARVLVKGGIATLLLDLLTPDEQAIDLETQQYRSDIDRLAQRVVTAIDWAAGDCGVAALPLVCFGAATSAAATLMGAAERSRLVHAVVLRSGRPDQAGYALAKALAPTLLLVDRDDESLIELNRAAMRHMRAPVQLHIVPGATDGFEEWGAPDLGSQFVLGWCRQHLPGTAPRVFQSPPPCAPPRPPLP